MVYISGEIQKLCDLQERNGSYNETDKMFNLLRLQSQDIRDK